MQLSPHFSLAELTHSARGEAAGLSNVPPPLIIPRLRVLAARLEIIRTLLGDTPLHVNSAYRSAAVNHLVGGVPNSAHLSGYAADITHDNFSPLEICQAIAKDAAIVFDQVIHEFTWCHFAYGPLPPRRQLLTAVSVHGKTRYRSGL